MNCRLIFLTLTSILACFPLIAQNWIGLVNDKAQNSIVRDTFLLQTFQGKETDNWSYTSTGSATVEKVTASSSKVGSHGEKAMQLKSKAEIKFSHFDTIPFDSVAIHLHSFALLENGEKVFIRKYATTENRLIPMLQATTNTFKVTRVKDAPGLDIVTQTLTNYFQIDTALVYGCNAMYTLFTGTGNWSEASHWTHKPARRTQKALVNGALTLDQDANCVSIQVNNGSVYIPEGKTLQSKTLTIYDKPGLSTSFINKGTLNLAQSLVIDKTFAEKGKWYFFSLPFDVYSVEGFTLKDETETGSGNYFYLQTYDSQQRATSGKGWKVVKTSDIQSGQPIIRKHQGYLIALDEAAKEATLRFRTTADKLDSDFGRSGSISINATTKSDDNSGWTLCGNPLPTPLHLSDIVGAETLDGYVYVYTAGKYQAYPLNSDYAIAPYSAFFVKANEDATLTVKPHATMTKSGQLLSCEAVAQLSDPQSIPTATIPTPSDETVRIIPAKTAVSIEQLPTAGIAQWIQANGRIILTQSIPAGSSVLPYPTASGIYLLRLSYGTHTQVVKCKTY